MLWDAIRAARSPEGRLHAAQYNAANTTSTLRIRVPLGPTEPRLADTLRPDPDRIPIKDGVLLRELSDRLYEHNFDPEPLDSKNGMRVAIRQFQ